MFDFFKRKKVESYTGDLAQTSLPEMLYVLYRHGAAGLLDVTNGQVTKRVYLKSGACIHATSDDPQDRLLPYLRKTERISAAQEIALSKVPGDTDRERGFLLIDRGVLSPADLYNVLRERIEHIVWGLFWWKEGQLIFNVVPEEAELVNTFIPIRHVILHGIRRAPSAKELTARLGKKSTLYEPDYELADLVEVALERDEHKLLALVNGTRSLYEVCAQGPFNAAENAKLLYAFYVLRLIKRAERQPEGGGSIPPPPGDP